LRKSLHHLKIIGGFDDQIRAKGEVEECPYRGSGDDLMRVARSERIDEIILAVNEATPAEINSLLAKLSQLPINTKICAFNLTLELPVRGYTALAGLPLLHVFERPLSGWGSTIKTVEDKILGGLILVLVAPLLLLIGLLVKLDSQGPVLFRQKRYGFNNNEITIYKFRTMYQNGETNPTVPQAKRNDPRVTRLGWFLRKSSLDELPQLINVLQGEMSLVGPRPHAVEHNQHYGQIMDGYLGRHRVKPGITGWAQVNGLRGETNSLEMMRLRVQYDLYYIDHWSIYFDVKILVLTVLFGFFHKNAY
ncbi:MAG: exopolysaccharide biosynthesis polyprenyl glycosylphosphotransferase, partial [Alphaproteobacteria bacterium]|nr:exopolysaccharide biosynthesis polyprenyl glycosylphosphotransferase [Alphaproteobacteria bacterium]